MADIIERAETALAGIREGQWIVAGAEELEAVTRELIAELKAERAHRERLFDVATTAFRQITEALRPAVS
ncbi:MAG: hypothetical protein VYA67_21745 [Actinomycetota bacterium]|nr:hypothetical protein [Actinomycetota bacterium]